MAIVVLDCSRITTDIEEGEEVRSPTVRILRIEPETDPDRAAQLLAWAARLTNQRIPPPAPVLPGLDLDDGVGLRVVGDHSG